MSIRLRSINSFVTVILIILAIGSAPVAADTYYFHTDHLGTPQALTDANQQVVWQGEYSPFGEVSESVNAVTQNLRFPGQYFDRETELHYNYFRTYNSTTGRYIESDPIGLIAGPNTYSYGSNSPILNIDLLGLFDFGPIGGMCCNFSSGMEFSLGGGHIYKGGTSEWSPLPPGACTSRLTDCDGMTCGGKFQEAGNFWSGNPPISCGDNPTEDEERNRWPPEPGQCGIEPKSPAAKGSNIKDQPPPGYQWKQGLLP